MSLHVHQLGSYLDYPAVIVEQVPHSNLLSYAGLACEQSIADGDHQQLLKGQQIHNIRTQPLLHTFIFRTEAATP